MKSVLIAAVLSLAAATKCIDTQHKSSVCVGDKYQKLSDVATPAECCAACAADSKCVQWTHHAGNRQKCILSSVTSTPEGGNKKATCGQKSGPAPPSPPSPPPAPPSPPPPSPGSSRHWAVIMAGSNSFGNYRHQADACHAYQIAKKNGIPESQIILLAYDDIAHNEENPFKGQIFNKPTAKGTPGVDVYAGCKISYKGNQVIKDNFIKVLSGDISATGPVLKSTSEDHVFVYYADHGGVGILGVPDGAKGGYIHAADVNKAIETLHSKGGYKELLFYLEACESGSIFNKLLKAPNAKAVTAANPKESSWGWYCPGQMGGDKVDGKEIGSCLGDEFSVRWMEDTEAADSSSETVGEQFSKLVKAVTKSHVQEYGVKSFDTEPIGDFQGDGQISLGVAPIAMEGNGVDSRQVELHQAYYKVERATTAAARKAAEHDLAAILARRHAADKSFAAIASSAVGGDAAKAREMLEGPVDALVKVVCHQAALEAAVDHCGAFNDYSLRYSRLFANLCESGMDEQAIVAAIKKGCEAKVVV